MSNQRRLVCRLDNFTYPIHIEEHTGEVQRLDKELQDAGIKRSSVATRVLGVSGRAMLDALIGGSTDSEGLAPRHPRPAPYLLVGPLRTVGRTDALAMGLEKG